MKKKLLLLGLLPVLGVGAAANNNAANASIGRNDHFFTDTANNRTKYCEKAMKLNSEIADEGVVLLKNSDNFLPLAKGSKISLAGKSSVSLVRGGAGSGSGSVANGITEVKMDGSLKDAGFDVNKKLVDFYNSSSSGNGRTNGNTNWTGVSEVTIGETPLKSYSTTVLASLDEYKDAAVFVISREGSEGCDVKTCNAHDSQKNPSPATDRHALQMSANEEALFGELKKHTENIVIVVNSGNIFECDVFEKDPAVKAIIWMGTPGANGAGAVGRIMAGDVNPSGKTVDTWTRDFTLDPSFQNFSDNSQNNPYYDVDGNLAGYAAADTMFNADGTPVRSPGSLKQYTEGMDNSTIDANTEANKSISNKDNWKKPYWENKEHKVINGGLNGVKPSAFVSYEEGIYVDYRYYESAYADMAATDKAKADAWYNGSYGVVYPFGYGLSYTSFTQEIVSCNVKDAKVADKNTKVEMTVKVTNTGTVAGKDAIQVYFKAPYIPGGIEKAYNSLCAIEKTDEIAPGASQEVKVDFYLQDVANYDFSDANNNGFKGYELDAGKYGISINKSAHEEYASVSFELENGFKYGQDRYTGEKVQNRFTDRGFYSSLPTEDDFEFTQMSRTDFDSTFPTWPTIEDRTLGANSKIQDYYTHAFSMEDIEVEQDWSYVPEDVYKTKEDILALKWEQAETTMAKADRIQFEDMVGKSLDDPAWDDLLNQFTYNEMVQFVNGGGQHNPEISSIGKPSTGDSDGPSKFQIMWWCGAPIVAATFNPRLAKAQGECVGEETHVSNNTTYGWAGPAVNIHRSPFGGRNFEYYSADPFLSGKIAGRVVAGATDKGIYCFFKHFAVNDQEKNREGVSAFLTEQALREIYLKPFQMCIQEGKATGIMSSYNRIGLMEAGASYPLLTEVLRKEWGFKGSVLSDMTHYKNGNVDFGMYENINNRILSGCNQQLDQNGPYETIECVWDKNAFDGKGCPVYTSKSGEKYESYTWWYALRNCCKECLWMCCQSGAMYRTCDTLDKDMTFSGAVNGVYTTFVNTDIEIVVNLVGYESDCVVSIDPATPLPEGLTFDGTKITGKVANPTNVFIHVIVKNAADKYFGNSFELAILATPEANDVVTPPEGGGCCGSIVAASALISTLALAGAGLLVFKKRKED